jgi:ribosome-associated heat shock protein Hsp15
MWSTLEICGHFKLLSSLPPPKDRLDKWLFHARFHKTRGLAAQQIEKGRIRINGQRTTKPGHAIRTGDVLTFAQGDMIRVIRVLYLGVRRGPATEAQALYADLEGEKPVPPLE